MRDLGQGAYGKVYLAKDKLTDKIVAVKSVNKQQILQLDKKRHVYREKNLLSSMQHPFVIKLITTMIVMTSFLMPYRMTSTYTSCLKTVQTGLFSTLSQKNVRFLWLNMVHMFSEKLHEDLVR